MTKFVSYEKMSKKAQREYNLKQRNDWNGVNPVTRVVKSKKAYNRQKFKKGEQYLALRESVNAGSFLFWQI